MTAPGLIRRLRAHFDDAQARRLRVELDKEKSRNRRLEQRVADLQLANEGAYHALTIERGAACIKADCARCKAAAKETTA
ncbi:hypothetical protein ACFVP3_23360 [Streptomyces sp. NPDC057806]|uniref:hypothetical protein n=1 Tax=Streptomyces sp. NPDC057806 TaxID=3346255 RepID=UPI003691AF3E